MLLKAWQSNLADEKINELVSMSFKQFITSLDDMIKEFQKNLTSKG